MQKEETILVSKISRWVAFSVIKTKRMIGLLLIIVVLYLVRNHSIELFDSINLDSDRIPNAVFYGVVAFYFFNIFYAFIKLRKSQIVITNFRAMQQSHGKKKPRYLNYIPLAQIASVTLTVTFFGRIFGYGRVIVRSSGTGTLDFNGLAKARKVCDTLNEQIRALNL